jgi:hypothetical protein
MLMGVIPFPSERMTDSETTLYVGRCTIHCLHMPILGGGHFGDALGDKPPTGSQFPQINKVF